MKWTGRTPINGEELYPDPLRSEVDSIIDQINHDERECHVVIRFSTGLIDGIRISEKVWCSHEMDSPIEKSAVDYLKSIKTPEGDRKYQINLITITKTEL